MYTESVVTFIDIMGFKELVKSRPPEEVDRAVRLLRRFAAGNQPDPLGMTSIAFSDSIIRMRPIDKPSAAFFELLDLVQAQGELIGLGILIRGGIALGKVANQDGRAFGPGFIEAYELESKCAIYPRVVVSPKLLQQCVSTPFKTVNEPLYEYSHIAKLLRCGDDGVWHIDYLGTFPDEMDDPNEQLPDWLLSHKKLILEVARSSRGELSGLGVKANWLANYHNHYISGLDPEYLASRRFSLADLVITPSELQTMFVFPP